MTVSGSGDMASYDSPSQVPWYSDNWKVKSVVIESGVTSVGDRAFCGCTSLITVTLGDSVTCVGAYAFYGCTALTSVDLGESVESISKYAFHGCTALKTLVIPDSVTIIGSSSFYRCTSLESVTMGDAVSTVDNFAFSQCSALKTVIVGASVKTVGNEVFSDCVALTSISLPDSVTSVKGDAFRSCTALESVTIGNSLSVLDKELFKECVALQSLVIGSSVTDIGDRAFYGCTALKTVVIPDSVKTIRDNAFGRCSNLTGVVLGDSVESLGRGAFSECTCIKSVEFPDSIVSIAPESFSSCKFYGDLGVQVVGPSGLKGHMFHGKGSGHLDMAESHTPGEPTKENVSERGYDEVTYCTVCGIECSRTYIGTTADPVVIDYSEDTIKVTIADDAPISQDDVRKLVTEAEADSTKTLDVNYGESLIHLDNTALKSIDPTKDIEVKVDRSESEDIPHAVGTSVVYDISLGDNHVFNGGLVTVTVPYNGPTDNLKVYYMSDGEVKEAMSCTYADGKVTFSVGHLSTFVIVRAELYLVTFENWNDDVISSTTYYYGDLISTPLNNPIRDSDDSCEYTFKGWKGYASGMTVSQDVTFTADYDATPLPSGNDGSSAESSGSSSMTNITMVVVALAALAVVGVVWYKRR